MYRIFSVLLMALLPLSAGAATIKLATIAPDGTSWMKLMRQAAKEIAHRTNGRVMLRLYPGGVMGNAKNVLRKIRIGQLHGGAFRAGALHHIYPDMALYSLPLLFRSPAEVQYVRRQMDHVIIEGLKKRGFVSFGLGDGGFAYFMSNKPLASAAQLRHQKVWIPQGDRISEATLQAFGVSPVPLPLTDVLTGLQTGLIDTVAVSPVGAIALQWHTRVRYLTHVPLLYLFGTIVIQQKALNRLSDDDKKVVADVMRKTSTKIGQQAAKDNKAALQALKKQGVKFIEPSAAERRRWHDRVQSAIVKLGREHAYSAEGLRKIRAYLDEYRKRSSQK